MTEVVQIWPCKNCGAETESDCVFFRGDLVHLSLSHFCGSDKVEIYVECKCSWGCDWREDVSLFVCRNCGAAFTREQIRELIEQYRKALSQLELKLA